VKLIRLLKKETKKCYYERWKRKMTILLPMLQRRHTLQINKINARIVVLIGLKRLLANFTNSKVLTLMISLPKKGI
jgi:hypothetical protein